MTGAEHPGAVERRPPQPLFVQSASDDSLEPFLIV